jgi:hypothetical protein
MSKSRKKQAEVVEEHVAEEEQQAVEDCEIGFEEIDKLTNHGINAGDVQKL